MLMCGIYNPPKHKYRDSGIMNYLISFVDSVLDKHPDAVIVCGGDVNRLDMQELKALSGWNIMVDFPTRGNACLENCFTNRPDVFRKAYPIHMLMKTEHEGFVLPAGTKLKPTRRKVLVRDCREQRKRALYLSLAAEDWGEVITAEDINVAVGIMEDKIRTLMDKCMPLKSVRMSSRDPVWMSPLVRSMLRAKSRISDNNVERLKLINSRISEVIKENSRYSVAVMGSREWWKKVDSTSQRRNSTLVNLDNNSLDRLNGYFGQLCSDESYVCHVCCCCCCVILIWKSHRMLKHPKYLKGKSGTR